MRIGALDVLQLVNGLQVSFVTGFFFVFLILLLPLYALTGQNRRWTVLLGGSLLFLLLGAGVAVTMIPVLMTTIAFPAAIMLENTPKEHRRFQRFVVLSAVLILLTALSLVKLNVYYGWSGKDFLFPIGISYYTFSLVSYLADVYWRRDKAEYNFWKLLLFTVFFPRILQGPITRHRELAPQLLSGKQISYRSFCFGIQLMLWGYFKKLVIADRLLVLVQTGMGDHQNYGGALLFSVMLLSSVQLYCDFSGCMDIASGVAEIFGIALPRNFNHPFFSQSAAEFWRRWHMTLGQFFTDYVYMPVVISPWMLKLVRRVRTRRNEYAARQIRTAIPIALVWLCTSLWHGLGENYLVWGVYWGGIIILSSLFSKSAEALMKRVGIRTESSCWSLFRQVRTFLVFSVGRVISMPSSLRDTGEILGTILTRPKIWELFDGSLFELGLNGADLAIAAVGIIILWTADLLQTKGMVRERIAGWNIFFRTAFYSVSFLTVLIFGMWGPSYNAASFAYMNF